MDPDVPLGMEIGRLGAAVHFEQFRNPNGQETRLVEKIESASGIGAREDLDQFVSNPLGGDDIRGWGELAEGSPGGGIDGKAELHGKADGTKEAETIFGKSGHGISDRANDFGREVGLARDIVEELVLQRVKKHSVDGEVAALGVLFGGGEGDGGGPAPIVVGAVDPEGGDFENMFIQAKSNDTEGFSLGIGSFREERLDLVGRGRSGDVDVGVGTLKESIANAPAGVDGGVTRLNEGLDNLFGGRVADHGWARGERRVR